VDDNVERKLRPDDVRFARVMLGLILSLPMAIILIVMGCSNLMNLVVVYGFSVILIAYRKDFFELLKVFFRHVKG